MENLQNYGDGVRIVTPSGEAIGDIRETHTGEKKCLGFLNLPESMLFAFTLGSLDGPLTWSIALPFGMKLENDKKTPYIMLGPAGKPDSRLFFLRKSAEVYSNDENLIGIVEWKSDWSSLCRPVFLDAAKNRLASVVKCKDKPLKKKYPYTFQKIQGHEKQNSLDPRLLLAWILWVHVRESQWPGTP